MSKLSPLLRPRSVAVVGATEKEGFGGSTVRNLLNWTAGNPTVFFVNPNRQQVMGAPCFRSLRDLPSPVECAVICTPAPTVIPLLREAAQAGAKAAVVYAAGFREAGAEGEKLEQQLVDTAAEYGMLIAGPNCAGIVNVSDRIPLYGLPLLENIRSGHTAVIGQSGQIISNLLNCQDLAFSLVISSGNEAVTTTADYLEFLAADNRTQIILLYLEGIRQGYRFVQALAECAKQGKTVIVLKTGRSERAAAVARSHTGSLVGSDATFEALCRKYALIRVDDLDEMIACAQIASVLHQPGSRVGFSFAMAHMSGGEAAIFSDLAAESGLLLSKFAGETTHRLRQLLPEFATVSNPLDMTAALAYDEEVLADALETVLSDPSVDGLVVSHNIPEEIARENLDFHRRVAAALLRAKQRTSKPLIVVSGLPTPNPSYLMQYREIGVPVIAGAKKALLALARTARHRSEQVKVKDRLARSDIPPLPRVPLDARTEYSLKASLATLGFPVPRGYLVRSARQAADRASQLGFPVVLKIQSPDVPHKSDVGGVALNLRTAEEVIDAYESIVHAVTSRVPHACVDGVLVEEMIAGGLEVIIGVKNDPDLGPTLVFGPGGIFVEIFGRPVTVMAPITYDEALELLEEGPLRQLLAGFRGSPPRDTSALAQLLVLVGRLASTYSDRIVELDLNPVLVRETGRGVVVADALAVMRGDPE